MEIRTTHDKMPGALQECNLCQDILWVVYPNKLEYGFMDMCDELWRWYSEMEANVERGGGYMIDKWQFVDANQHVMDLRARVKLIIEE